MDQRRSIPVRLKETEPRFGTMSFLCMYNCLLNVRRNELIHTKSRNGRATSIISLSIENRMRLGGERCVGHVSITLGTLLDACSGDKCSCGGNYVVSYLSPIIS
jgi:hypothetical protein